MDSNQELSPIGVLKEIAARLAAITPEKFSIPPQAREKDAHLACMATDDIKRLFTLRVALMAEVDAIIEEGNGVASAGLKKILGKNWFSDLLEAFSWDDPPSEISKKLEGIRDRLLMKAELHHIVDRIFWLEVKRQHRDLANKPTICIYSDWSLCWQKSDEENGHGGIKISIAGPFSLPAAMEMLARRRGGAGHLKS